MNVGQKKLLKKDADSLSRHQQTKFRRPSSNNGSQNSNSYVNKNCIECWEKYSDTTSQVDWIQCTDCENCLHETCAIYDLYTTCGRENVRQKKDEHLLRNLSLMMRQLSCCSAEHENGNSEFSFCSYFTPYAFLCNSLCIFLLLLVPSNFLCIILSTTIQKNAAPALKLPYITR